jgi:hypothetical protein
MPLPFLFLIWLVIALIAHALLPRYAIAASISAVVMVLVTQFASYIELGHTDPLWVISSLVALGMALVISLIIGLPFRLARRLKQPGKR